MAEFNRFAPLFANQQTVLKHRSKSVPSVFNTFRNRIGKARSRIRSIRRIWFCLIFLTTDFLTAAL